MRVSVIIPTYNRKEVLELVLKSLAYQSYDPKKYEVIVVDDGGDDGTDKMVKKMTKEVPYELRYYWQERKGFRAGQARNLGVKHAKGELIIFLDSDVIVVPDFINEHVEVHKRSKKAVCIGYVSGHITGTLQNKNYDYEEVKKIIDNNPNQITQLEIIPEYRDKIYHKCNDNLHKYRNPWEVFYTNNVSILKKDLEKFDENFIGWGYEDIDLGYRLFKKKLGFKLNRNALGYSLDRKESHPCPMFDPQKDKFEKTLENIKRLAKKHSSENIKEYCWREYWGMPNIFKPCKQILLGTLSNDNPFYEVYEDILKEKTTEEIKKELEDCKQKFIDKVIFAGGEPAIREDFFELLDYANILGINVTLETNAKIFCYKDFTKKVIKAGVKSFIVKIWSHNQLLHDFLTRREGSFKQTVKGIKNLFKYNVNIKANVLIVKQNVVFLNKITKFLLYPGIRNIQYTFLDNKYSPSLREVGKCLNETISKNKKFNFEIKGLPEELIKDIKNRTFDPNKYSDEEFKEWTPYRELKVALLNYPLSVLRSDYVGGAERATLLTLDYLTEIGVDAKLFGRSVIKDDSRIVNINVKIPEKVKETFEDFSNFTQKNSSYFIKFVSKTEEYNIYHGNNTPVLNVLSPKKSVVYIHNYCAVPDYNELKEGYVKGNYIFNSKFMKNWFLKNYPQIPEKNCFVVYYGINTKKFYPNKKTPNQRFRVYYGSSWNRHKGIFVLLDAIRILEKERNDFEVYLGGSPYLYDFGSQNTHQKQMEKEVLEKVKNLKSIKITGAIPYNKMPEAYQYMDTVIFPSTWQEPFGLISLEAMACGVPVIASNVGGIPEAITPGRNGYLINPDDPVELSKAIEFLIERPQLRANLGLNGRERVEKDFNIINHSVRLLDAYSKIFGFHEIKHVLIKENNFKEISVITQNLINQGTKEIIFWFPKKENSPHLEAIIPYIFEILKLRDKKDIKIYFNKYQRELGILTSNIFSGPKLVQIDIINKCNYNCLFCVYHSTYAKRDETYKDWIKLYMPFSKFKSLIDELKKLNTERISIAGCGEPFMHPDIEKIIKYVKKNKMTLTVFTNGSLFNKNLILKLVKSGVDELIVNISAGNENDFKTIRPDQKSNILNLIEKNLKCISVLKRKNNSNKPYINLMNVLTNKNKNYEDMIKFAVKVNADMVTFCPMYYSFKGAEAFLIKKKNILKLDQTIYKLKSCQVEINNLVQLYKKAIKNNPTQFGEYTKQLSKFPSCYFGWYFCRVAPNGDINYCCSCPIILGNIYSQSFEEIWESEAYESLRKKIINQNKKKDLIIDWCARCCHVQTNEQIEKDIVPFFNLNSYR